MTRDEFIKKFKVGDKILNQDSPQGWCKIVTHGRKTFYWSDGSREGISCYDDENWQLYEEPKPENNSSGKVLVSPAVFHLLPTISSDERLMLSVTLHGSKPKDELSTKIISWPARVVLKNVRYLITPYRDEENECSDMEADLYFEVTKEPNETK